VCALIEWAHESDHPRAIYLRENDYLGATLFRPGNAAEYIERATAWVSAGRSSQMSEADRRKRDPGGFLAALAKMGGGPPDGIPF
jgi:hypothetical protein